jgi:hypothetical protein
MNYTRLFLAAAVAASSLAVNVARADGKRFVEASKSCAAFWETIALDTTSKDNQIAQIIEVLEAVKDEAGLVLPRQLSRAPTEMQRLMRAVSPICQALRLRAGVGTTGPDAPAWLDVTTGSSIPYCRDGTPATTDGFATVAGQRCRVLEPLEDTLLDFADVARLFQSLSNRIEGDVVGNAKIAIVELDARFLAGSLSSEASEKLDTLKQRAGKFGDFWLMTIRAWQALDSDVKRLTVVAEADDPSSVEVTAADVKQCPADSCVFDRTFCYQLKKKHAVVYHDGESWYWWGNGSSRAAGSLDDLPPEFTTVVYSVKSRRKKEVPNSELSLVSAPRGSCKAEDLAGFSLKLSKIDIPTTKPEAAPTGDARPPEPTPPPSEEVERGKGCPMEGLAHKESRWFDLAADGTGDIPGAILKLCVDGRVSEKGAPRCNAPLFKLDAAQRCVRTGGGGPTPPPTRDCAGVGLADREQAEFDMPAVPSGVPGSWIKECKDGALVTLGLRCNKPAFERSGESCVPAATPTDPTPSQADACTAFGLAEGGERFEDMPLVDGRLLGRYQLLCSGGKIKRYFFCLAPARRDGDRCVAEDLGSVQPPPPQGGGDGSTPAEEDYPDSPVLVGGGDSGDAGDSGGSGGSGDAGAGDNTLDPGGLVPGSDVPGGGGITITFTGSIIGTVSQLVIELFKVLFQGGNLPPAPGQAIFQGGCLLITGGSGCLATASGGVAKLGPLGTLIDSITRQPITIGGHALKLTLSGKMLIDAVTGKPVLGGNFLSGGAPAFPGLAALGGFTLFGKPLNTGTPIGTVPGSATAPINLDTASERPKFEKIDWLKALNAPGTGTSRPDSVNLPATPGGGGSSVRNCTVNGVVYRHGREWTQNAEGGFAVRYRCDNGERIELSRSCQAGLSLEQGVCKRGCERNGVFYEHRRQWDETRGVEIEYLRCEDGRVIVQERGCIPGYSRNEAGQCLRSCGPEYPWGSFYPPQAIANGRMIYQCLNGAWSLYNVECDAGYDRQGDSCVRQARACAADTQSGQYKEFSITGGSSTYLCNDGQWEFQSVSCSSGYTQSGRECVRVHQGCGWPGGGSLGHDQQNWYQINGGAVLLQCSDGQLRPVDHRCAEGFSPGQITQFPFRTCTQMQPRRSCTYQYLDWRAEVYRTVTIGDGQLGVYHFEHGQIAVACDDGTMRARGLPQCERGYVFQGGILGALGSIIVGNNNMRCVYQQGSMR